MAGSALGGELYGSFQRGRGGPGGWWIIDEPELHFVLDAEFAVPDLPGWRRERMPSPPRDHRFTVVPDWVCEIISKATESKDREIKMPVYARYGVAFDWLIDPGRRTLEVYRLADRTWHGLGRFEGDDAVAVPPFEAATIDLSAQWIPGDTEPPGPPAAV
jgi:Uma2 family endonuclease